MRARGLSWIRARLAGLTATRLAGLMAVLAAVGLSGSLVLTGFAIRMDQREKAALAALADYGAMVSKLGADSSFSADSFAATDAAYLSAWLSVFQSRPGETTRTLEETCRTGRGGAGVRLIRVPGAKPAGLAALESVRGERLDRLGPDVYVVPLARGVLCPGRSVEAVVVRRDVGPVRIVVGRVVEQSGAAWGWAVLAVLATGAVILISGLTAAMFARRRLTAAITQVSQALDRAAVGDFTRRAPQAGVAPELTELTAQVNRTLDRLQELLGWLRDSSDQLAHDFRTPLARAATRLDRLRDASGTDERDRLIAEAGEDIRAITRAMNEAMSLRDGEAWVFDSVRLDEFAAQAAELYQPIADLHQVSIVVEGEAAAVLGVRSLLQRAMANLVDNAVKFSPDGGVVRIRVWQGDDGPVFSVADQGPGIDPEVLTGGPSRRTPTGDGRESHGMGLPFVRAIVRRHGGEMTIDDAAPGAIVTARFSG